MIYKMEIQISAGYYQEMITKPDNFAVIVNKINVVINGNKIQLIQMSKRTVMKEWIVQPYNCKQHVLKLVNFVFDKISITYIVICIYSNYFKNKNENININLKY